jgi:hypothetical protein
VSLPIHHRQRLDDNHTRAAHCGIRSGRDCWVDQQATIGYRHASDAAVLGGILGGATVNADTTIMDDSQIAILRSRGRMPS